VILPKTVNIPFYTFRKKNLGNISIVKGNLIELFLMKILLICNSNYHYNFADRIIKTLLNEN